MKKSIFRGKKVNENSSFVVPFYGVRGSIKSISLDGNYFDVIRYGVNGEDGERLVTPKKYEKNLMINYIDDVKKYLEVNDTKFLSVKGNLSKKVFSKKKIILGTLISTLLATSSILGTIFSAEMVSYTFLTLFFFSFIASCYEVNELKKYIEEEKNKKFINEYKKYQDTINSYNISIDKLKENVKTNYNGLGKKVDENKVIDIDKKKILKKNNCV